MYSPTYFKADSGFSWFRFKRYADPDGQAVRIGIAQAEGMMGAVEFLETFLRIAQAHAIGARDPAVDQLHAGPIVAQLEQQVAREHARRDPQATAFLGLRDTVLDRVFNQRLQQQAGNAQFSDPPVHLPDDAEPGAEASLLDGQVSLVGVYVLDIEKQARTVDIDVSFTNLGKKYNLMPGYSADVEIISKKKDNQIRIPTEALLHNDYVYLYKEDDKSVYKSKITTGLSNWKFTEVLSGLNINDRIVRNTDVEGLEDGVKVKVESTDKQQ